MSDYKEGDILTNAQGQKIQLQNNQWVPYTQSASVNPQAKSPKQSAIDIALGGVQNLLQGATLGWAGELQNQMDKEMQGLGVKPMSNLSGDQLRAAYDQQAGKLPAFGLQMAGMLLNPVTRNMGARMIASSPFWGGAATGGLYGAISGAGESPDNRLQGALTGGAVGGLLGGPLSWGSQALAQKALPSLLNAASSVKKFFQPATQTSSQQADDILRPFMQQSFSTPEAALAQAKNIGPQGTLMDMSPEMAAVGSSAYNKMVGGMRSKADQLFTQRNQGAIDRIGQSLDRTFGKKAQDISGFIKNTLQSRADESIPLYKAAYSQTVPEQTVDGFTQSLNQKIASAENTPFATALTQLKKALYKTLPDGTRILKTDPKELSFARDALADKTNAAFKAGNMKLWNFLKGVRNEFDSIMPQEYQQANQLFSTKSGLLDAADYGQKFFNPSTKTHELIDWLNGASDSERVAYITGLTQAAKSKMGGLVEGAKVSRIFNMPNVKEKLSAVIGDPTKAEQFISDIERENLFKATQNLVSGNSFTVARQEANKLFDQAMGNIQANPVTDKYGMMRLLANKLISAVKLNTGISKQLQKSLEDRLTTQGVTPEVVQSLMSTPAKDIVKQTMIDFSPKIGQASEMVLGNQSPNISKAIGLTNETSANR